MKFETAPRADRRSGTERRSGADRRRGRPPLADDPSVSTSLRWPPELLDRLCRAARRARVTPSALQRQLLDEGLTRLEASFVTQKSETA